MEKKLEQEYETAGSTFNQGAKNEIQIADISFIQKTKDIEDGSPINGSTSKHEMMDMKDKIQDDDSMLKYKAKSQHPEHPDLTELDKGDAQWWIIKVDKWLLKHCLN